MYEVPGSDILIVHIDENTVLNNAVPSYIRGTRVEPDQSVPEPEMRRAEATK